MSRLSRLSASFALVVAAAALTASPALARKDHDRMPDKWEKRNHLNVKQDDSRRDRDRDRLSNYGEYRAHTNPRKKDSDRDGRRDGREDYDRDKLRNAAEIKTGFDPGDKDSDDDGVKDGRENAGRIVKLSGNSVTIKLAVGGSLTAGLRDDLAVECAPTPGSGSGTGSGSGSSDDAPEPGGDESPEPGEDEEPGDLPELPEDAGEDGEDTADGSVLDGDAPDSDEESPPAAGEDDEWDESAFNDDFDDAVGGDCGTTTLKVGATVHKAKVTRSGSGRMLVSLQLLGT
jgi:hypothetical protein